MSIATTAQAARPQSGSELKDVLDLERRGEPFLLYRDDHGGLTHAVLSTAAHRLTIGRRDSNDIALPWDGEVSRVHATVERIGDEWVVADDGLSRNGTFVNGERVGTRRRLLESDVLRVGRTVLTFREPRVASAPTPEKATSSAGDAVLAEHLTPTQRRILVALCQPFSDAGHLASPATNKQIAAEVFLSVEAVKKHLQVLFDKFGIRQLPQNQKRLQLVELALLSGLVNDRDR